MKFSKLKKRFLAVKKCNILANFYNILESQLSTPYRVSPTDSDMGVDKGPIAVGGIFA